MPWVGFPLTKNVASGIVGICCTDSIIACENCFILLRISFTMFLGRFHRQWKISFFSFLNPLENKTFLSTYLLHFLRRNSSIMVVRNSVIGKCLHQLRSSLLHLFYWSCCLSCTLSDLWACRQIANFWFLVTMFLKIMLETIKYLRQKTTS